MPLGAVSDIAPMHGVQREDVDTTEQGHFTTWKEEMTWEQRDRPTTAADLPRLLLGAGLRYHAVRSAAL
jgi:hypothetical protein